MQYLLTNTSANVDLKAYQDGFLESWKPLHAAMAEATKSQAACTVKYKCHGWGMEASETIPGLSELFKKGVQQTNDHGHPAGHGKWSIDYLIQAGCFCYDKRYMNIKSEAQLQVDHPEVHEGLCEALRRLHGMGPSTALPLYYATGQSLRSVVCSGQPHPEYGTCPFCLAIGTCQSSLHFIKKRAKGAHENTGEDGSFVPSKPQSHTRNLSAADLAHSKIQNREAIQKERFEKVQLKAENKKLKKRLGDTLNNAIAAYNDEDYPVFLRQLITAQKCGRLLIRDGDEPSDSIMSKALHDILTGISTCLMNATTAGRILSENEKLFYAALLNVKGPWTHKFVSGTLLGPHERTSARVRSELSSGFDPFWSSRCVAAVYYLMKELGDAFPAYKGLEEVPGVISEDASTLLRGVDLERVYDELKLEQFNVPPGGLLVRVWGLNGGERLVKSVDELKAIFEECTADDVASYLYVWSWVPCLKHGPIFPLRVEITNNKFDRYDVFDWWRQLDVACAEHDLNLLGHVHDGDARCRAAGFYLARELGNDTTRWKDWLQCRRGLDHELLDFLQIAVTKEGHHKQDFTDWLHLGFRLRRHLLDPERRLHIGPGMYVNWRHLKGCPHLRGGDLRHSDKQNWEAVMRIFSMPVMTWLEEQMEKDPEQHNYMGTLTYLKIGYNLLAAWLDDDDEDPLLPIQNAAWALTAILYWRFWLDQRENNPDADVTDHYRVKDNFQTRETFLDEVISASTRILLYVQYRDNEKLREWKPQGDRVSSRFSEYIFQFIRMLHTNTPAVRALGAVQHLKHFWAHTKMQAAADFAFPNSKCGMATKVAGNVAKQKAPPGYYKDNATLKARIDEARDDAISWLMDKCKFVKQHSVDGDLNLTQHSHFFAAPCLHFPRMEGFSNYIQPSAADNTNPHVVAVEVQATRQATRQSARGQATPAVKYAKHDRVWFRENAQTQRVIGTITSAAGQRYQVRLDVASGWGSGVAEVTAFPSQLEKADDRDDVGAVHDRVHPPEAPATADEEQAPGEEGLDGDSSVAAVFEDLCAQHYQDPGDNASSNAVWAAMSRLMADFNRGKLAKQMQEHRQWRFIGKKLFEEAQKRAMGRPAGSQPMKCKRQKDPWDEVGINYDICAVISVDGRVVWRVGNVEGIRRLKSDPGNSTDYSKFGVDGYPEKVHVDDPRAVFTVRWYRECDDRGRILSGYQNRGCKNRYFLPMFGEAALEPVVDVGNHWVLDSVQMTKVPNLRRVWEMAHGNKGMIQQKFDDSQ